jgi:hypothetical protein
VQANVEEGEKSEHAAKTDQIGQLEELAQRSDGERKDQEAERPIAGGVLKRFDRIGAQISLNCVPAEQEKGNQAHDE